MKSKPISKLLGFTAGLTLVSAGALRAQPPQERYSIMLGGSVTGSGDAEYSGDKLGEVETARYSVEASHMIPVGEQWMFEAGLGYNLLQTDQSAGAPLVPEDLTKFAVNLRAIWRRDDEWSVLASISPGFYGDDEVDVSDGLNVPLMVLGKWQKTENLSLALGVRVDVFSEMPVLPVFGVEWKINSEWQLALGAPRTELRYQWNEHLSLYGGAALEGESYAVDNPSLVTASGRSMGDTYLSEMEIRAVAGFEYRFDTGVTLNVEGGYSFGREFDYYDKDVKLEVDPAAFGAVSVSFDF
ncbi:TonB-dependent receptor [Luteolibacter yonseiensis]|uniref:TonB-dependent receptor n=1 Tax=Luteolibacter yonseiensis TaxID=1144680 RepID=A0A934R0E5_9BACT|nr:DUF6268 family outer membrane beta-barrel protein [Luteolibacter yonseiensis]MBK1814021.1 TonB-dependent receptor [Luteolibacter yonseiensis]